MNMLLQDNDNDNIEYGTDRYVTYYKGDNDTKIILLATHGGELKPDTIPDRDVELQLKREQILKMAGQDVCMYVYDVDVCVEEDSNTLELALLVRTEIEKLTNSKSHLIACNLHRSKIDMNRDVIEATLNSKERLRAYDEFHGFVETAKKLISRGIIFDIHGQAHPEEWVELGYCIYPEDLRNNNLIADQSSIKSLTEKRKLEIEELINGNESLGYLLQQENIKTVPSPNHRHPSINENYYRGGYNVRRHGSMIKGDIDAIQIESPLKFRIMENIVPYAQTLSRAIFKFMTKHY